MAKLIFINRFYAPDESTTSQLLTDLYTRLAARSWEVGVITSYDHHRQTGMPPRHEISNDLSIWRVWTPHFGARAGVLGRLLEHLVFYVTAFVCLLQRVRAGDGVVAKTDPR